LLLVENFSRAAFAPFAAGAIAIGKALIAVSTAVAAAGLPVASSTLSPAAVPTFARASKGAMTIPVAAFPNSPRG
jgi:hypothetical protein